MKKLILSVIVVGAIASAIAYNNHVEEKEFQAFKEEQRQAMTERMEYEENVEYVYNPDKNGVTWKPYFVVVDKDNVIKATGRMGNEGWVEFNKDLFRKQEHYFISLSDPIMVGFKDGEIVGAYVTDGEKSFTKSRNH